MVDPAAVPPFPTVRAIPNPKWVYLLVLWNLRLAPDAIVLAPVQFVSIWLRIAVPVQWVPFLLATVLITLFAFVSHISSQPCSTLVFCSVLVPSLVAAVKHHLCELLYLTAPVRAAVRTIV
jgi:hypothetical protein